MAVDVGAPAPGFTLPTVQGQKVSLSDFKGHPVLMKIGTTWCPGCIALGKELAKLGEYLEERGVVVLDVFVQDSKVMVEKYLHEGQQPKTYHALLDNGTVHVGYNVYLIPRLLIIDADQVVQLDSAGREVSDEDIRAVVEKLTVEMAGSQGQGEK